MELKIFKLPALVLVILVAISMLAVSAETTAADKYALPIPLFSDYKTKTFAGAELTYLKNLGLSTASSTDNVNPDLGLNAPKLIIQDSSIAFFKFDSAGGKFLCAKSYVSGATYASDASKCLDSSSFDKATFQDGAASYYLTLQNYDQTSGSAVARGTDVFISSGTNTLKLKHFTFVSTPAFRESVFQDCGDINGKHICVLLTGDLGNINGSQIDSTRIWISVKTGSSQPATPCTTIAQCLAQVDKNLVDNVLKYLK